MTTATASNGTPRAASQDDIARAVMNMQAGIEHIDHLTRTVLNRVARFGDLNAGTDARRDVNKECGYPSAEAEITLEDYRFLYDREPIARKVVEFWPKEAFKTHPTVYEDEDADKVTAFEEAWDALGKSLAGRSWHKEEEGSCIWGRLKQADIDSGVGRYGILLLGLDDGLPLSSPVAGVMEQNSMPAQSTAQQPAGSIMTYSLNVNNARTKGRKLLYLRSFTEENATVSLFETNESSPRYCHPVMYSVTLGDPFTSSTGAASAPTHTREVHWTRVIHIPADESGDVFGTPRMQVPYNRLLDLYKTYGGGAEGYWKSGASHGISLETHPHMGGTADVNIPELKEMAERYEKKLSRFMALIGMHANVLAPPFNSPEQLIDTLVTAVSICVDVPKRILMGSERGELSSAQDSEEHASRLHGYRTGRANSRLIVPLANRLIMVGVLPEPKEGYLVYWPRIEIYTPKEKAAILTQRTQAFQTFVQGNVEALMTPLDWLTREAGYTEEEAEAILEATGEAVDDGEVAPTIIESQARGGAAAVVQGIQGVLDQYASKRLTREVALLMLTKYFLVEEDEAEIMLDGADEVGPPPAAAPEGQPGQPGQPGAEGEPPAYEGEVGLGEPEPIPEGIEEAEMPDDPLSTLPQAEETSEGEEEEEDLAANAGSAGDVENCGGKGGRPGPCPDFKIDPKDKATWTYDPTKPYKPPTATMWEKHYAEVLGLSYKEYKAKMKEMGDIAAANITAKDVSKMSLEEVNKELSSLGHGYAFVGKNGVISNWSPPKGIFVDAACKAMGITAQQFSAGLFQEVKQGKTNGWNKTGPYSAIYNTILDKVMRKNPYFKKLKRRREKKFGAEVE